MLRGSGLKSLKKGEHILDYEGYDSYARDRTQRERERERAQAQWRRCSEEQKERNEDKG